MNPLDPDLDSLVREWIGKANADLEAAEQLLPTAQGRSGLREIVAFHCQQAVEKYLKAFLTYHQIDFPKTHSIRRLLRLAGRVNKEIPEALRDAAWLTPFGVEARYPDDAAEILPGGETKAVETARAARDVVLRLLNLKP
jgi:HEPN domain-containing protein